MVINHQVLVISNPLQALVIGESLATKQNTVDPCIIDDK